MADGVEVGNYTITEGEGIPSLIVFTFDSSFHPEPGQTITLFTIQEGEEGLWEGIDVQGQAGECLVAYGQVSRSSYQLVFEEEGCKNSAPHLATSILLSQMVRVHGVIRG